MGRKLTAGQWNRFRTMDDVDGSIRLAHRVEMAKRDATKTRTVSVFVETPCATYGQMHPKQYDHMATTANNSATVLATVRRHFGDGAKVLAVR